VTRIAIALAFLGMILIGSVDLWRSDRAIPGVIMILVGLSSNAIMAATRRGGTPSI
jgi:hypothetical protein